MREVEEVRQKEAYHNDFLERPRQENEEGYGDEYDDEGNECVALFCIHMILPFSGLFSGDVSSTLNNKNLKRCIYTSMCGISVL